MRQKTDRSAMVEEDYSDSSRLALMWLGYFY